MHSYMYSNRIGTDNDKNIFEKNVDFVADYRNLLSGKKPLSGLITVRMEMSAQMIKNSSVIYPKI